MKLATTSALLLLLAAPLFSVAACGDSGTNPDQTCEPGTEIFCKCRGGFKGTRTCLDDGQSFGECTTEDGPCPTIDDTSSSSSAMMNCDPGVTVFCQCTDGSDGTKTCDDAGQGFSDCENAAGTCGGVPADKLLYDACTSSAECVTGLCDHGFCSRDCGNWTECVDEANERYGDCVRLDNMTKQICAPYCIAQTDCTAYGASSLCGGAVALDDPTIAFAVCANWGTAVTGIAYGTPCDFVDGQEQVLFAGGTVVTMDCDLGLAGQQNVCLFGECSKGCYESNECPQMDCTSDGTNAGCCASDPQCN
ncbi:MAG: hypothetical protein U0271_26700 [Polyangiaceae bacterium]